jgi:hypothetical protein
MQRGIAAKALHVSLHTLLPLPLQRLLVVVLASRQQPLLLRLWTILCRSTLMSSGLSDGVPPTAQAITTPKKLFLKSSGQLAFHRLRRCICVALLLSIQNPSYHPPSFTHPPLRHLLHFASWTLMNRLQCLFRQPRRAPHLPKKHFQIFLLPFRNIDPNSVAVEALVQFL